MNDNNTTWQPVEPTTPVQKRLYERTAHMPNPYEEAIPIPPPPPKQPRRFGAFLVIALLLVSASVLAYGAYSTYRVLRSTPPTPTPTTTYTADDILNDMVNAGCPCQTNIQHGVSTENFIDNSSGHPPYFVGIPAESSISWEESTSYIIAGLWVYKTTQDATDASTQVGQQYEKDNMDTTYGPVTLSTEYIDKRCMILVDPPESPNSQGGVATPWSGYQQAIDKYCV